MLARRAEAAVWLDAVDFVFDGIVRSLRWSTERVRDGAAFGVRG